MNDPYGQGWLLSIEPASWEDEVKQLVCGDAIEPWVEAEIVRYRAEGWLE